MYFKSQGSCLDSNCNAELIDLYDSLDPMIPTSTLKSPESLKRQALQQQHSENARCPKLDSKLARVTRLAQLDMILK